MLSFLDLKFKEKIKEISFQFVRGKTKRQKKFITKNGIPFLRGKARIQKELISQIDILFPVKHSVDEIVPRLIATQAQVELLIERVSEIEKFIGLGDDEPEFEEYDLNARIEKLEKKLNG